MHTKYEWIDQFRSAGASVRCPMSSFYKNANHSMFFCTGRRKNAFISFVLKDPNVSTYVFMVMQHAAVVCSVNSNTPDGKPFPIPIQKKRRRRKTFNFWIRLKTSLDFAWLAQCGQWTTVMCPFWNVMGNSSLYPISIGAGTFELSNMCTTYITICLLCCCFRWYVNKFINIRRPIIIIIKYSKHTVKERTKTEEVVRMIGEK